MSTLTTPIQYCTESSSQCKKKRQGKEIKGTQKAEKEVENLAEGL